VGTRLGSNRARRKLVSLRLEVARAKGTLSALQMAIRHAHSDPGLAAMQGVRAENEQLQATNRLAAQAASSTLAALDVAVKAAQTDPLTGLRNRSVLWDRLSHALDLAGRSGQHLGVFLLDVDDLKHLNDQRGHAAGDLVLQQVAGVLTATVRASDTVCRIGGDEFVVVAATLSRDDVDRLARKIEQTLRKPFLLAGQPTMISVSVGFSVFPEDGSDAKALVQKADEAMYRAKLAAKGRMTG